MVDYHDTNSWFLRNIDRVPTDDHNMEVSTDLGDMCLFLHKKTKRLIGFAVRRD